MQYLKKTKIQWGKNGHIKYILFTGIKYYVKSDFVPNDDADNTDGTYLWENWIIKQGETRERYQAYIESSSIYRLKNVRVIDIFLSDY
ncbi:hypothetical protein AGMMS49579_24310 [Spirochaetia bacterium]|nr:hypothetical protein AGMMS49579_24310 [Spirochaetia bacterium]